jgi:hypothetical protein
MNSFEKWLNLKPQGVGRMGFPLDIGYQDVAKRAYLAGLRRGAERLRKAANLAQSELTENILIGHAGMIESEASLIEGKEG